MISDAHSRVDTFVAQGAPARVGEFDLAVAGAPARLLTSDGRSVEMAVRRWHQVAAGKDLWMLTRCAGPTIDLGCGPGRLVRWLLDHGVSALGVDSCAHAGAACGGRREAVLHADVFDPLPQEGRWGHVLLADGNVGIGGDPVALLTRCAALLAPRGTVLVELQPGARVWSGHARLQTHNGDVSGAAPQSGPWFRWASVGLGAIDELAAQTGLRVVDRHHGQRSFAQLRPATTGTP